MDDKERLLDALEYIDVRDLDYQEWVNVGMALKEEGHPCSVWEAWSRNDDRYHRGECERKWNTFGGSGKPITGATIMKMAQDRGYTTRHFSGSGIMEWNDVIEYDGDDEPVSANMTPTEELAEYIRTLYRPDDHVGFVVDSIASEDAKKGTVYKPSSKGVYDMTAGEMLEKLYKHPDDIAWTIGDYNKAAGAWIRFNPLDGEGVSNTNVTAFRYALVESDTMTVEDQIRKYKELELPIACLVTSGNKSVHAIVHIGAEDAKEYRDRVSLLYSYLESKGIIIDKQNSNPSRLSRMPGADRGDKHQSLIATNVGRKSWEDWLDSIEGFDDPMPGFENLSEILTDMPPLSDELIGGVLRCGHKMLISGSSKAGKSFMLIALALCLSSGSKWLGLQCKRSKVVYVNLEIDSASCAHRFEEVMSKLGFGDPNNIDVWNLRGKAVPLDKLVPRLIKRMKAGKYDAVIIDPIYKVITGDENNASDMANFCNQFDKICAETGCAAIYCHHHSKGAQGSKRAMDRASGSGVFARDPDAQLDIIELELSDNLKANFQDNGATAWRIESSLREFKNIKPINIWFEYPIHRVDETGELAKMPAQGSFEAGREKNRFSKTIEDTEESFRYTFDNLSSFWQTSSVAVKDMAERLGVTDRTVRRTIEKMSDEFELDKGLVRRKS